MIDHVWHHIRLLDWDHNSILSKFLFKFFNFYFANLIISSEFGNLVFELRRFFLFCCLLQLLEFWRDSNLGRFTFWACVRNCVDNLRFLLLREQTIKDNGLGIFCGFHIATNFEWISRSIWNTRSFIHAFFAIERFLLLRGFWFICNRWLNCLFFWSLWGNCRKFWFYKVWWSLFGHFLCRFWLSFLF